jgi:hypothetical protein
MANIRIFEEVEALVVNGEDIGGASAITLVQEYAEVVRDEASGEGTTGAAQGAEAVDRLGERTTLSAVSTDVTQLVPLLVAAPAAAVWLGHESGLATFGQTTVGGANSKVIIHAASLAFSRSAYGLMTFDAIVGTDGDESWSDYVNYLNTQAAPAANLPTRLWKPTTVMLNAVSIGHLMSMNLNLGGRLVQDWDGDSVGVVADFTGWSTVTGSLVTHEQDESAELTYDLATKALEVVFGVSTDTLAVTLDGAGNTADQILTLQNVKLLNRQRTAGRGYTENSFDFECQWRDATDPWALRTLDDATPANRLINFAAA